MKNTKMNNPLPFPFPIPTPLLSGTFLTKDVLTKFTIFCSKYKVVRFSSVSLP